MALYYRQTTAAIFVTGKTFPYRDALKALGASFVSELKAWQVPLGEENLRVVAELCKSVGGGPLKLLGSIHVPTESPAKPSSINAPLLAPAPDITPQPIAEGYTIASLMAKVQLSLSSVFPTAVWVMGEVQNLSAKKSGVYWTLAEPKGKASQGGTLTISATLWNATMRELGQRHGAEGLASVLQEGMRIRVLCQVTLYRDRGSLSLNVIDIDPAFTKGALALARQELLRELRAKGLDTRNKALPVPVFPLRIGLITATGSRAHSDFLDQLSSGGYPGTVLFHHAEMQGENLVLAVIKALKAIAAEGVDLIVLTRGGGSAADLRWFDVPEVAYAICAMTVPIIAAIGHHDDISVAELVSAQREKTPTAAAEFVLRAISDSSQRVSEALALLGQQLTRRIALEQSRQQTWRVRLRLGSEELLNRRQREAQAASTRVERQALNYIAGAAQKLLQQRAGLLRSAETQVHRAVLALSQRSAVISAADPKPWLSKGFTRIDGPLGPVREGSEIKPGDLLRIRLLSHRLRARVTEVEAIFNSKELNHEEGNNA